MQVRSRPIQHRIAVAYRGGLGGLEPPIDVAKKLLLCQKCVKMQYFHPKILKSFWGGGTARPLDPSNAEILGTPLPHIPVIFWIISFIFACSTCVRVGALVYSVGPCYEKFQGLSSLSWWLLSLTELYVNRCSSLTWSSRWNNAHSLHLWLTCSARNHALQSWSVHSVLRMRRYHEGLIRDCILLTGDGTLL